MSDPRSFVGIFFVLTAFGLLSLLALIGRTTFGTVRAVDAVHLIGTGMCFGGAIMALAAHLHTKRKNGAQS